jgi:hypothetical protein
MTVRASMLALIDRVRTLIADSSQQVFSDQQIQEALDARRIEKRHVALRPDPTFQPGGAVVFKDYYSDTQYWEDDVLFQDQTYATITPLIAEAFVGHWQFEAQPNGIGIRATGKAYDLYGAAADLLEAWAAQVMLQFDATTGRDSFTRSQKFTQISALAARYRAQALVQTSRIVQSDVPTDVSTNAVVYPYYGDIDGY